MWKDRGHLNDRAPTVEASTLYANRPKLLARLTIPGLTVEGIDQVTRELAREGLARDPRDASRLAYLRLNSTVHAVDRGHITLSRALDMLREWGLK